MNTYIKRLVLVMSIFFSFSTFSQSQVNKAVIGKIKVKKTDKTFAFVATVTNKTENYKNLRYEFALIKKDLVKNNTNKTAQDGNFTLEEFETKEITSSIITLEEDSNVIIFLLVYNNDEEQNEANGKVSLVAKDRMEIIGLDEEGNILTKKVIAKVAPIDGLEIKGVMYDETRTKFGRLFFEKIYNKYNFSDFKSTIPVTIKETLGRGRRTIISITVEDKIINKFISNPKDEYLESMSNNTMRRLAQYFNYLEKTKQTLQEY